MTDIKELFINDDSSNEITTYDTKLKRKEYKFSDDGVNTDSDDLLEKCSNNDTNSEFNCSASSSEDEMSKFRSLKHKFKYNLSTTENLPSRTNLEWAQQPLQEVPPCEDYDVNDESDEPKSKRKKSQNNQDKQMEKLKKEQEKIQKRAEREKMKAETAKAKATKQAMASAYKNLRPEECLKFITTVLDSNLISSVYGSEIPSTLQAAGISYRIVAQTYPCIVTWTRQQQLTSVAGQLAITTNKDECNEVLLVMLWSELVELIHQKNLSHNMQIVQSSLPNKQIFLAIYGLENYFKFYNAKSKRNDEKTTVSKRDQIYADAPRVSRKDVDLALMELQIMIGCSHRMVELPNDVGSMVAQFTKSIAQAPYKIQKQLKQQQMDWFVSGDNKDCVRVDKSGNGLLRLWRQQLTQFSLARLETAEAISSKYPSPFCLMQAYGACLSKEEGESLLQDIPIRRAAGPITSVRKIGPELSKKVYNLFTSLDGELLL